ncbi:MAG: T9SS type A sorting domain-containing protein [bacterium]
MFYIRHFPSAILIFLISIYAVTDSKTCQIKGRVLEAGVKCICPVEGVKISIFQELYFLQLPEDPKIPENPVINEPLPLLGFTYTDSAGYYTITMPSPPPSNPEGGPVNYRVNADQREFKPIDTIITPDKDGNAEVDISIWRRHWDNKASLIEGSLEITLETEKKDYNSNEPILIRYTLKNISGDPEYRMPSHQIIFDFNTGCQERFTLLEKNRPIWSFPNICDMVFTSIILDPGDARVFETHFEPGMVQRSLSGLFTFTASLVGYEAQTSIVLDLNYINQQEQDRVNVIPESPSAGDSITFNLFNISHCCCVIYQNKSISVQDTAIYLSYEADDRSCALCRCFMQGSWTDFKTGPLKPGKYGIYKAEQYFCPPGEPCPAIMIMPKRVGEVAVKENASALEYPSHQINQPFRVYPNPFNGQAVIHLGNNGNNYADLSIYTIDGSLIKNYLNIKTEKICWDAKNLPHGIYIIKANLNNKEYTRKIFLQK